MDRAMSREWSLQDMTAHKERKIMSTDRIVKVAFVVSLSLAAMALLCGVAGAQSAQLQGVINGRSGATMTVQSQDLGNVVVLLTDETEVDDESDLFDARRRQMGVTARVPGPQVQGKGSHNAKNETVADSVKCD